MTITSTIPEAPGASAAPDDPGFTLWSPQALIVLVLALLGLTEAAVRVAAPPAAGAQAAALRRPPPPPLKRAALLYFGNVGALAYDTKEAMLGGGAPWTMEAAEGARPFIQQHVLDYNGARGWQVDTFMHTWQEELEEPLVALLAPRNHSAGPQLLHGAAVRTGMAHSLDLVLQQMLAAQAEAGVDYDRALFVRFDTIFHRGFSLDGLSSSDAFYVASWCTANQGAPLPPVPGTAACFATHTYWADEEGVPDFWFAGSPAAVTAVFERMGQRMASGAIHVGRTCNGCGHAQVWGAVRASGVPLRRWGFHQIDDDLFRDGVCNIKWQIAPLAEVAWMNFSGGDESPGEASICDGSLCAVDLGEMKRCGCWSAASRPW